MGTMEPWTQIAALLAAGAVTGLLGAVLGIGGGVFLVPALVLWFQVDMTQAVAAGLVAVIATSSAAASVNVERGTANMPLGLVLENATVLGALCGSFLAAFLAPELLIGLFGALLAVVTALLWRGPAGGPALPGGKDGVLGGSYYDPAAGRTVSYSVRRLGAGLGVSFVAGNLSGLLGVGGGVLKVPVLHLYCGMPMKAAAATSNFMIGVTAAAGALVYFGRGEVDPVLSGTVALGVLGGSLFGTALSGRLRDRSVRRAFALLTFTLSVQMLRRAFGGG